MKRSNESLIFFSASFFLARKTRGDRGRLLKMEISGIHSKFPRKEEEKEEKEGRGNEDEPEEKEKTEDGAGEKENKMQGSS